MILFMLFVLCSVIFGAICCWVLIIRSLSSAIQTFFEEEEDCGDE